MLSLVINLAYLQDSVHCLAGAIGFLPLQKLNLNLVGLGHIAYVVEILRIQQTQSSLTGVMA